MVLDFGSGLSGLFWRRSVAAKPWVIHYWASIALSAWVLRGIPRVLWCFVTDILRRPSRNGTEGIFNVSRISFLHIARLIVHSNCVFLGAHSLESSGFGLCALGVVDGVAVGPFVARLSCYQADTSSAVMCCLGGFNTAPSSCSTFLLHSW